MKAQMNERADTLKLRERVEQLQTKNFELKLKSN